MARSVTMTMNDVLATPLLRNQLAAYQTENRGLKRDLADALCAGYEEQPLPDSWDKLEILVS
jgi:hypothetical protein